MRARLAVADAERAAASAESRHSFKPAADRRAGRHRRAVPRPSANARRASGCASGSSAGPRRARPPRARAAGDLRSARRRRGRAAAADLLRAQRLALEGASRTENVSRSPSARSKVLRARRPRTRRRRPSMERRLLHLVAHVRRRVESLFFARRTSTCSESTNTTSVPRVVHEHARRRRAPRAGRVGRRRGRGTSSASRGAELNCAVL